MIQQIPFRLFFPRLTIHAALPPFVKGKHIIYICTYIYFRIFYLIKFVQKDSEVECLRLLIWETLSGRREESKLLHWKFGKVCSNYNFIQITLLA